MDCPGVCYTSGGKEYHHVHYNTDYHKKMTIISDTIAYVKCDRCKKDLQHWDKNTQVVYCNLCGGKFCIDCWVIQRDEEEGNTVN